MKPTPTSTRREAMNNRLVTDKMGFEDLSEEISPCHISRPRLSVRPFVGLRTTRAGLQVLGAELLVGARLAGRLSANGLLPADACGVLH